MVEVGVRIKQLFRCRQPFVTPRYRHTLKGRTDNKAGDETIVGKHNELCEYVRLIACTHLSIGTPCFSERFCQQQLQEKHTSADLHAQSLARCGCIIDADMYKVFKISFKSPCHVAHLFGDLCIIVICKLALILCILALEAIHPLELGKCDPQ